MDLELGQMLLSNTPWNEYEADWATDGLNLIAECIAEFRGNESVLTTNSGGEPFENTTFAMRSYCWCDGDIHMDTCPPNFEYKINGFTVSWYKHAGRGITANMKYPGAYNWVKAINTCVESIFHG